MKKIKLFFLKSILFVTISISAQDFVNVPNVNFKNTLLVNTQINKNNDGEISVEEAKSFSGKLDVSNKRINDLTGIEAFVNIAELDCSVNKITSLDISSLIKLRTFICTDNKIKFIDLSKNVKLETLIINKNELAALNTDNLTELKKIDCSENVQNIWVLLNNLKRLGKIDVSKNEKLEILYAYDNNTIELILPVNSALKELVYINNRTDEIDLSNQKMLEKVKITFTGAKDIKLPKNAANLSDLNVSYNNLKTLNISNLKGLKKLNCNYNELVSLNLKNGANSLIESLSVEGNPNLTCIQVDSDNAAIELQKIVQFISSSQGFTMNFTMSENCNTTLSVNINEEPTADTFSVYPNPVNEVLNIETNGAVKNIIVYSIQGVKMYEGTDLAINTVNFLSGIYIIEVISEKGKHGVKKFIKN